MDRRHPERRAGMLAVWVLMLATSFAQGDVDTRTVGPFNIRFYNAGDTTITDVTGEQDWTETQIQDVVASVGQWNSRIDNTAARQINVDYVWVTFSGATLGGASSNRAWYTDHSQSFTMAELAWREGVDYDPSGWDALVRYDIDAAGTNAWYFGSGTTPSTSIDFRSVVTHEMGHVLGFASTYTNTVTDSVGGTVTLDQFGTGASYDDETSQWTWYQTGLSVWDNNLVDGSGVVPELGTIDGEGYPVATAFNTEDNPVYWTGANAVAYNDGELVEIYAPETYTAGSSLSHLNYDLGPVYPNSLMDPFTSMGESPRTPSELEWQMMKDMGWSVVPEPATMGLMAIGAVLLVRRRRRG